MNLIPTITKYALIPKDSRIAVAVSGGSDSIALLHYLYEQQFALHFSLHAINVEHGIRGANSLRDTAFTRDFCETRAIPFHAYTVDAKAYAKTQRVSIETAARLLRYECFNHLLASATVDRIATAHNANDRAESLLLHLFRGSGLDGMQGIAYQLGNIIRPLLDTEKTEIMAYIQNNQLNFVEDETNLDTAYTRNFIRHEVLPLIQSRYPHILKTLNRFSDNVSQDSRYLTEQCQTLLHLKRVDGALTQVYIDCPKNVNESLLTHAFVLALEKMGADHDIEQTHLAALVRLAKIGQNGSVNHLPFDLVAAREYDHITLYRNPRQNDEMIFKDRQKGNDPTVLTKIVSENEAMDKTVFVAQKNAFSLELASPFVTREGKYRLSQFEIIVSLTTHPLFQKGQLYVDADKIPTDSIFRFPLPNDHFRKFGGGDKKLCDYMTDQKIPKRVRATQVVLASGHRILALLHDNISEEVQIDKSTTRIWKID